MTKKILIYHKGKILDFLSSPKSQIVFFNAPQEEGLISDEDRFLILEGINEISYLENKNLAFLSHLNQKISSEVWR